MINQWKVIGLKNYKLIENSQYWDKYYNKKNLTLPNSDFSKFALTYIKPKSSLIDIGCGDGRDSWCLQKII